VGLAVGPRDVKRGRKKRGGHRGRTQAGVCKAGGRGKTSNFTGWISRFSGSFRHLLGAGKWDPGKRFRGVFGKVFALARRRNPARKGPPFQDLTLRRAFQNERGGGGGRCVKFGRGRDKPVGPKGEEFVAGKPPSRFWRLAGFEKKKNAGGGSQTGPGPPVFVYRGKPRPIRGVLHEGGSGPGHGVGEVKFRARGHRMGGRRAAGTQGKGGARPRVRVFGRFAPIVPPQRKKTREGRGRWPRVTRPTTGGKAGPGRGVFEKGSADYGGIGVPELAFGLHATAWPIWLQAGGR